MRKQLGRNFPLATPSLLGAWVAGGKFLTTIALPVRAGGQLATVATDGTKITAHGSLYKAMSHERKAKLG